MVDIQILATSDLHGKFYNWDYAKNAEDNTGSLLQLSTAIKEKRHDNTIVIDAGDTIQDNSAEVFIDNDIHPMIVGMNMIGYDVWVTGNHEYNFGVNVVKKVIKTNDAHTLVSNVWDTKNVALADPYTIIEKSGVRIGIIGVVTPNIAKWDAINLEGCKITDPVIETKKIIEKIKGQTDILIAVAHMDINDELGTEHSGVISLANECPELNLIIASHGHNLIEGMEVNGVLIVENKDKAQTLSEVHFTIDCLEEGCRIINRSSRSVKVEKYICDIALEKELSIFHKRAIENAEVVIGNVVGGNLTPDNEINGILENLLRDSAMIDIINEVQLFYSGAKVSATTLGNAEAFLGEGSMRRCDVSLMYKYNNALCKLRMTGEQLKRYMEWSAKYFNQFKSGDLTISFNENVRTYNYDLFDGVRYEIDISKPEGNRIVNLRWLDDELVRADDIFEIAVNGYRASTNLLIPGEIFDKDDMPVLLEAEIRSDIGGVRDLIADYIINELSGVIKAHTNNNWKLVGFDWDEELHMKAVQQINAGIIKLCDSADERTKNVRSITINDLI